MSRDVKVSIRNLHKAFGSKQILKGIDLDIYDGEIIYIIGKSGSGKSVTLKHISALLRPDQGSVLIDREDLFDLDNKGLVRVRRKLGVLFQMAALFDSMNVFENIAFTLRRFTKMREDEISEVVFEKLKLVGLSGVENLNPAALSMGMQKRVGLARAIALEPQIILYDEPTTGVDPILGSAVDDLIKTLNSELGVTSIVISHDMKSTFNTAQRIAMLYDGEFRLTGPPELFKENQDAIVRQFIDGHANGPIPIL